MAVPKTEEGRERWISRYKASMADWLTERFEKTCVKCGAAFKSKQQNAKYCPKCKVCSQCGTDLHNDQIPRGTCVKCAPRSDAQNEQLKRLHESIRGENNPSKRPEVRAILSEKIAANHPSKKYPEWWAQHAADIRPKRVSKLEDRVAPYLPEFQRQFKLRYSHVDFADPERKVVVEIQGCWHHCCPICFPDAPQHETQRNTLRNDKAKKTYMVNRGWRIVYVWEHDLKQDWDGTIERLKRDVYDSEEVSILGSPPPAPSP